MFNKLIDLSYIVYIILVIISLVSFFGSTIYYINSDQQFINALTCNKTSLNIETVAFVNGQVINTTQSNNIKCDQMQKIVDRSNNLIYFVIIYWVWLLRKDFKEFGEWFKKYRI